jgi:hypothetical protein
MINGISYRTVCFPADLTDEEVLFKANVEQNYEQFDGSISIWKLLNDERIPCKEAVEKGHGEHVHIELDEASNISLEEWKARVAAHDNTLCEVK